MSNNVRNVTKQLLGAEDVAFGRGVIQQNRGGTLVPVHKLDLDLPVVDEAELAVTNPNEYPKASIGSRLFVAVNGQYQELSHIVPVIYRVGGMISTDYPYCENGNVIAKWTGAFPKTLTVEDADFSGTGWQIYTVGSGRTIVSETQPPISYGAQGIRWYNPSLPATFIYYVDGDSGQWVEEAHEGVDGALRSDLQNANSTVSIAGVPAKDLVSRANFKTLVELGGVADGVTDNRSAYVSAINSAVASGFTLVVTRGVYGFTDWIPLVSNLRMVFEEGAEFKLLNDTGHIGGFVIGGVDLTFSPIAFSNVVIVNPTIDCNNLVGENGFNALNAENVKLFNPTIKNCKRTDVALGGRAFQFEGGAVKGLHVFNPQILNCSIGINSQGSSAGTYVAADINYYNVVMNNVDVPFNVDSGFANPEQGTPLTMSTTVHGATLYNCGRLTYSGVTDPAGGGIICGDRGYGLDVYNVRVINESSYGGIGAICRGTMFGVKLRNVSFVGTSATAIFDHNPVTFGTPSTASHPSWVDADDVTVDCNLDFVVKTKGGGGSLGGSSMLRIKLKNTAATVAGLCDTNAGAYSDAVLEIVDADNGTVGKHKGTGVRSLQHLFSSGNQLNADSLGLQSINQTNGDWNPTYNGLSGGPSSITMSGAAAKWTRTGDIVTVSAYVATSNLVLGGMAGAVVIDSLPFVSATYATCAVSFASGFTKTPLSGVVVTGENKLRLYTRSTLTGEDAPMVPADLQAGAVVNANALIFSISYKV